MPIYTFAHTNLKLIDVLDNILRHGVALTVSVDWSRDGSGPGPLVDWRHGSQVGDNIMNLLRVFAVSAAAMVLIVAGVRSAGFALSF